MVGATTRRSALVIAIAILALSFVSDGVPGHVRASSDPSTHIAGVQAGPVAPVPALRRQTSVGDWRFRADRIGGSRGALLMALISLLGLLALGPGTAHRTQHPPWTGPAHRRHTISLRAPPALRLT